MRWPLTVHLAGLPLAGMLLSSCTPDVPLALREPGVPLTVVQVQRAPQAAIGQRVRWGGRILAVNNLADHTELILLAWPLSRDGKPRLETKPSGRFIATIAGFVDPAAYPVQRLLTVAGPITGVAVRPIGEYPYQYPRVAAKSLHLWPASTAVSDTPPIVYGLYSDPFFSPFHRPWYGPLPGSWYGPWYGY